MNSHSPTPLPSAIEALIAGVMDVAELRFVDGRKEVERELRAHFEDGLAAGVSIDQLVTDFGDPTEAGRKIALSRPRAAQHTRREQGRWWMSPREWIAEAKRASKRLGRVPAFSFLVVATLALGVGANTAIFTVLNAVLLEELPYEEPEQLVRIYESYADEPTSEQYVRAPIFNEWREWTEIFESVGAVYTYRETGADLTSGDVPRRIIVSRVSDGFFETLGIQPIRGRTIRRDESIGPGEATSDRSPGAMVVVLSHSLWTEQFGGDTEIVGRIIDLNDDGFEVIGVMPQGYKNPFGSRAEVWIPQDLRAGGSNGLGNYYLSAIGRLPQGVTLAAAQARAEVLTRALVEENPDVGDYSNINVVPLHQDIVGSGRQAMLWILATAAGLVLLTACLNVANLLFARGLSRDRDFALRSALGSGRGRMITSIFVENGILAFAGGALGLLFGVGGVRALLAMAPDAIPGMVDVQISGTVFLFTFSVTAFALVAFGLAPAIRMSRTAPADVLRSGDRAATVGRAVRRVRDSLVVVQIAAALVLVAGATLLTRSFNQLVEVPLNLEPEGVLTYEVHLPVARYPDGAARRAFHDELVDRVTRISAVESTGGVSWLPVNGKFNTWTLYYDEEAPDRSNRDGWKFTDFRVFNGGYFESMGINLVAGVAPAEVDFEAEPMVWINESVNREIFDGEALGKVMFIAGDRRIMGIYEDVPHTARGEVTRKSYVPHAQYADNRNWALTQTVRAQGDLASVRDRIRAELAQIDPQLVMYRPKTFAGHLGTVRAQDRFGTVLMGAFALLALVLSVVGTYGVLSGSVAGRTREFGIRMALGADVQSVRSMVLRYAAGLAIPGIVVGITLAWIASRWIEGMLFQVDAADPIAYGGATLVFLLVGLIAALIPARKATRVDTIKALTAE